MMRTTGRGRRVGVALALLMASTAAATADDKAVEPALVVRAVGPDRQAEAVLKLFEGSKASSPAAAMANWRRATGNPDGLPKTVQAVAAMVNPEMVAEWRAFRDGVLTVGFEPNGAMQWSAVVPHDDGMLAAMVTSMRLSGGSDEPPLAGTAVKRMGAEGSALAAVTPRGTAFASRRAELAAALDRLSRRQEDSPAPDLRPLAPDEFGFRFDFDPSSLAADPSGSALQSQAIAGLRAAGLEASAGFLTLRENSLDLHLLSRFVAGHPALLDTPSVDPACLSWMPADTTLAAIAMATGRRPAFWDAFFEVADRVDRADPTRAQLQPLRVRLNLMAAIRGIRPEVDLWPLLRSIGVGVIGDPARPGTVSGAILTLCAGRPEDAERILSRVVKPALAAAGRIGGKPVEAASRGNMVVIGWGDGILAAALELAEKPGRSAAGLVQVHLLPVGRIGFVRASLVAIPGVGGPDSPLSLTLAEAAPIIWRGGWDSGRAWDLLSWGELKRSVAQFLERVPQAPPEAP